jgi:mannose-6-phosphate isomerase-like protein (cupin superfamily)/ADP-ribose pyrophosphatase YjhB (NUDIX family)
MTTADGRDTLPAVAGGVVLNHRGDVLVVSQHATSWSLPKGHVEPGESRREAAVREIAEESGLLGLVPGEKLIAYERSAIAVDGSLDETRRKVITLFSFTADQDGPLRGTDADNPEARWVPRDLVPRLLTHPADRAAFAEILGRLRPPTAESDRSAATRRRVLAILPNCPEPIVERFVASASAPSAELAEQAAFSLDKPYGENHIIIADGEAGLSFARLRPGQGSSFHLHHHRSEVFLVREGTLTLQDAHGEQLLGPGDIGCSQPGRPHAITNRGDQLVELLEIFSPALLDDKVRLRDRYDRPLGDVTRHQ